jgi:hypothetical protein
MIVFIKDLVVLIIVILHVVSFMELQAFQQKFSMVQNANDYIVYQVEEIGIDNLDPDIDQDGILYQDDNCPNISNSNQEDTDNDLIGDACDSCNELVSILVNTNGDQSIDGIPIINIFDVLTIFNYIVDLQANECLEPTFNINEDGNINALDVIRLSGDNLNGSV